MVENGNKKTRIPGEGCGANWGEQCQFRLATRTRR